MLRNLGGRVPHAAQIRLLMDVQRRRHTDRDKIHVFDKGKIRGRRQKPFVHQLLQVLVHHIANVVVPLVHHLHFSRLLVETDGLKSRFRLFHRQRQSHIAKADHAHGDLSFCDFIQ